MRHLILGVTLALASASQAGAQERVFYPAEAQAQAIAGRAVVECLVGEQGRLTCEVTEESPANMAFGAAALRMSEHLRVAPRTRDGQSTVGGRIRRTYVFNPGPPPSVTHE